MAQSGVLKVPGSNSKTGLPASSTTTDLCADGPDANRASKVAVGIIASERAEVGEMRDWELDARDVRNDPGIAEEILDFIEAHDVLSVAMTYRIIGCPHQEGIDYQGQWRPVCEFWKGRDRFTGERVH